MADYTTAEEVKTDLEAGGATATAALDTFLVSAITEASRLIDRYKQVEDNAYNCAGADETRYFNGSGRVRQPVGYVASITSVAVEETDGTYTTWTEDTDYFNWPENHDTIAEPIRYLEVNQKSDGTKSVWTYGQRRVKVVGDFGIATSTPPEVNRACKIQVQRWAKRAQQGWADASTNTDLGQIQFRQSLDPDVKVILDKVFPRKGAGI